MSSWGISIRGEPKGVPGQEYDTRVSGEPPKLPPKEATANRGTAGGVNALLAKGEGELSPIPTNTVSPVLLLRGIVPPTPLPPPGVRGERAPIVPLATLFLLEIREERKFNKGGLALTPLGTRGGRPPAWPISISPSVSPSDTSLLLTLVSGMILAPPLLVAFPTATRAVSSPPI